MRLKILFIFFVLLLVVSVHSEVKTKVILKQKGHYEIKSVSNYELNNLKKKYEVKEVPKRNIMLETSREVVNTSNAWKIKIDNFNITGLGETICIIDTGINYTHPDFGCNDTSFSAGTCKVSYGFDFCSDGITCTTKDNIPEDHEGHGTHVAGIISANGTIKGLAPESQIVIMKVCNNSGTCWDDDIKNAIDSCVGNATRYNISVISMSLGGGLYSDYCDNIDDPLDITGAINNARLNNISVIVAAGNEYSSSQISFPACIANSTAVTSSTKADVIASYSNRNALVKLISPGSSINSTGLNGYAIKSGTSMATPHVAAAFILLRQYKRLEKNLLLTPQEIEFTLNKTGKKIFDSSSSRNYSRIDIYSAILDLDASNPQIISYNQEIISINKNQSFTCNATDLQLSNISLHIWNETGLKNYSTISKNGNENYSTFNISLDNENYLWNCQSCDLKNNCNLSINKSLKIYSLLTNLETQNLSSKTALINLTCNASSQNSNLKNISLFILENINLIYNESRNITGNVNQSIFQLNLTNISIEEGEYSWGCISGNEDNISYYSFENRSLKYDLTSPIINISSPLNGSYHNKLNISITLNEDGNCYYYLDENVTLEKNNTIFYTESDLDSGEYNISLYCNDSAGNIKSELLTLNIEKVPPEVNLISPQTGTAGNILFSFNVSEENIKSCSLNIEGIDSTLNQSTISLNNIITKSLGAGTYFWNVNCSDVAGNVGNSSYMNLTVSSIPTASSSSGGGGSSSTITNVTILTKNIDISSGYTNELQINQKINFFVKENHSLKILKIRKNSSEMELNSEKILFNISINDELSFNLSGKNLSIRLNSIKNNKVNITINIKEFYNPEREIKNIDNETVEPNIEINQDNYVAKPIYIIFPVIVIFIIAVIIYFYHGKKTRKKLNSKS